ncbi:hypothetical protein BH23ACT10_BH23ACT10_28610 [soil metagenome]
MLASGLAVLGPSSPAWVGVLVTATAAVPALVMLVAGAASEHRADGVERDLLYRSTSVAFFVTMAVTVTYGLLETFADFAAASAWWFYGIGMVTWGITSLLLQRHFTR